MIWGLLIDCPLLQKTEPTYKAFVGLQDFVFPASFGIKLQAFTDIVYFE